jgi:hypothetical protein
MPTKAELIHALLEVGKAIDLLRVLETQVTSPSDVKSFVACRAQLMKDAAQHARDIVAAS